MVEKINVHITNDCNFDCEVCFEKKDLENPCYLDKDKLLAFIKDAKPMHVGFVGGEPLMHPNINEILKELRIMKIDTCLVTNGELLATLTELPNSVSIGIDNDDQVEVDKFLATKPECNIEITITPTDITKIDALIKKYKEYKINVSALAFWDKRPAVMDYINDEYIEKLVEVSKLENVTLFGENNEHYLRMFYAKYIPKDVEFECIAPLNIYSDGHLEWCDLENYPTEMTIEKYDFSTLTKPKFVMKEQCKSCNLRRALCL